MRHRILHLPWIQWRFHSFMLPSLTTGEILAAYHEQLTSYKLLNHLGQARISPPPVESQLEQIAAMDFSGNVTFSSFINLRPTGRSLQVQIFISLLTSQALDWAFAMWDSNTRVHGSFTYFSQLIFDIFEYLPGEGMHHINCYSYTRAPNWPSILL